MNSVVETATPAIRVRGAEKSFDGKAAVRRFDLNVPYGSTYGLLGPNGAGKTTVIRMILGILEPDAGSVELFGKPFARESLDRIGYLPEERGLYKRMTVRRMLSFLGEIKGIPARSSAANIDSWLDRLGLLDRADSRVQELSKGNQQKIQFIGSILHDPEIVILDEPFSGLDPLNQQVLKEIIQELKRRERTILFSTHIIDHAERVCAHVCIVARGETVADGTVVDVKRTHAGEYVALGLERWTDEADALLAASSAVAKVRVDGNDAEVALTPDADAYELLRQLVAAGVRVRSFRRVEPSLEQVFLERVGYIPSDEPVLEDANV